MSGKIRIELDEGQATIVLRALNLMAQQHFVLAIESDDELVRDRNYKYQDEYDIVFSSVYKQIADGKTEI